MLQVTGHAGGVPIASPRGRSVEVPFGREHSGPTPADDMAPQTITDGGNFTLDLKQRGFCASPLFLQTLGP